MVRHILVVHSRALRAQRVDFEMNVGEKDRDRTAMQCLAFDASYLITRHSHANEVKDQTLFERLRRRVMGVWNREKVTEYTVMHFSFPVTQTNAGFGKFSQFRYGFYTF